MKILFDQGTPVPLRQEFPADIEVATAYEMGWHTLSNGELIKQAETAFDLLITTDQNLRYQQNLKDRNLAILVLPTTSWPQLKPHVQLIVDTATKMSPGAFQHIELP